MRLSALRQEALTVQDCVVLWAMGFSGSIRFYADFMSCSWQVVLAYTNKIFRHPNFQPTTVLIRTKSCTDCEANYATLYRKARAQLSSPAFMRLGKDLGRKVLGLEIARLIHIRSKLSQEFSELTFLLLVQARLSVPCPFQPNPARSGRRKRGKTQSERAEAPCFTRPSCSAATGRRRWHGYGRPHTT